MVRPSREQRREAAETARIRRLEDAFQSIFEKIARHRPLTYDGVCNPVVLEAWIRELKKLFTATLCPEDQKVGIATYYLQKEADNWWSISRAAIQAQSGFGWALPDEASRVKRFEKNLTPKVRMVLAGSPSVTFQQAYDRALSVYESVKADEAEIERRSSSMSGVLGEKRPFSPQSSYQETKKARFEHKPSGDRTFGTPTMICYKCRMSYHPGKNCDGTPMLCFICKEPGHKAKDCPQKFPRAVRGPRSGSSSQAQKGRAFVMTRAGAESHSNVNPGIFP
ncbi:hypothetical protein RND81_03G058400 [Saponaria officinalis]|uniref:CCHC-type domain-containing protein n=1 Tax=Saponaria officinalis TaxID=3572 RepID=A0AAW1M2Z2_SAPOF